jgi:hypothetical protein
LTTYSLPLLTGASTLTGIDFALDVQQTGTPGLYRLVGADAVMIHQGVSGGTVYSLVLAHGGATLTGRDFAIDVLQTGTPGVYHLIGSDAVTLIHRAGGEPMPVAISAIETARTYRLDVIAPEDTEAVTLFQDGVRSGRIDKSPPWLFTRELPVRAEPYIIEARIEGPFGTLTAAMKIPDQPAPPPDTHDLYLAWDASADPSTVGYRMRAGAAAGQADVVKDAGNRLDGVLSVPSTWPIVYVSIAAYDAAGNETISPELEHTW